MRCLQCGKAHMIQKTGPVEAEYRNQTFTVSIPALVCPKCGFYSVDGGDDLTEMMRLLADEYRKKHGLLTSVEIKAFRDKRQETQKQFADYLRVGEASVKRWELGAIQDEAMDELIRLKCDPEKARKNANHLKARRMMNSSGPKRARTASPGKPSVPIAPEGSHRPARRS